METQPNGSLTISDKEGNKSLVGDLMNEVAAVVSRTRLCFWDVIGFELDDVGA